MDSPNFPLDIHLNVFTLGARLLLSPVAQKLTTCNNSAFMSRTCSQTALASTLLAADYETFSNTSMDKEVSNTTTILMSSAGLHKLL
jgi:hypothetical protein